MCDRNAGLILILLGMRDRMNLWGGIKYSL